MCPSLLNNWIVDSLCGKEINKEILRIKYFEILKIIKSLHFNNVF